MTTHTELVESTYYLANDGKRFSDKSSCEWYEKQLTLQPIYITAPSKGFLLRGSRVEVYSTLELAEHAISTYVHPEKWTVITSYIDEFKDLR